MNRRDFNLLLAKSSAIATSFFSSSFLWAKDAREFIESLRRAPTHRSQVSIQLTNSISIFRSIRVPYGVSIIGAPGTVIQLYDDANIVLEGNNHISDVVFDFCEGKGQVLARNAELIALNRCVAKNSQSNGIFFAGEINRISITDCRAEHNKQRGIFISGAESGVPSDIVIERCYAAHNGRDGIAVSGFGGPRIGFYEKKYAENITISNCVAHNNGVAAFNGITVPYATHVRIVNSAAFSNAEHGLSLQDTREFSILGCSTYKNKQGGLNMQSGYNREATHGGKVVNCTSKNNRSGVFLKERCHDITFVECDFSDNFAYPVRLVDINKSGLRSHNIRFIKCTFGERSHTIFNSNRSSNISVDP